MSPSDNTRGTVAVFVALSLVWGASFLFMKVGLEGLSPAQLVLGRLTLGAVALVAIMLVTRRSWPRGRAVWLHMLVVSLALAVIPYSLFAWAGQYLPSSLSSIYNATTPIMTLLLMPLVLAGQRLTRTQIVGLMVGLGGVVVLAAPWRLVGVDQAPELLPAQLACLGATVSYGFAGLYVRRFLSSSGYDTITLSTVQIGLAAVIAWVLAPFTARGEVSLDVPVLLAVAGLGVLGTGVAYIWYNRILRDWGPARASTVTYLSPVVGVVLGVVVLGESVHWNQPLGGLIVVLGVLASQGRVPWMRARSVVEMPADGALPASSKTRE
ncbi:drug/metabolite transporter (DMT)-like permease [Pseudoclavibacter sp. JAI123]|uniref:DMT family transporter n=1 Tax=Pseudoclavibacter sp. JAI123 TaxID=2723065 RepID=UPI0015CAD158|nr:DMT family transporter [Pseudoclavibacter sp. JAI123]NYF12193.1 drug/metabolite transporter (DMT)-like permease [Pseudoclavibacter sp. JAI123]